MFGNATDGKTSPDTKSKVSNNATPLPSKGVFFSLQPPSPSLRWSFSRKKAQAYGEHKETAWFRLFFFVRFG